MNKPKKEAINTYSDENDVIEAGMLSSPQISYCQDRYNIIYGFDKSCLKSATYDMRIGGPVLTWENSKKIEFTLTKDDDESKKHRSQIELQPNSLTFVTTIEEFNLPKDIIARFNLKSKWVHKGLLLGTGPIVDPELNARLLIPLHNFSSQSITIKHAKKLISVEFTKTLNPEDQQPQIKKYKYVKNESRIFDFFKYRDRVGGTVDSSVSSKFDQFNTDMDAFRQEMVKAKDDFQKETAEVDKSRERINFWGIITALATAISLIVLVFTTWNLLSSTFEQLNDAKNVIKQYKETNVDYSTFVLKKDYETLKEQFETLKKYTERVNPKAEMDESKHAEDIKTINDRIEKKIIESFSKEIENDQEKENEEN